MKREIIPFKTEEEWLALRVHDLTSSDVPCLFGVGYQTYEDLFECKLKKIKAEIKPNERIDWGIALQDAIAGEFARKNKWTIRKKTEYIRIPDLRIGSSFDFEISHEDQHLTPDKNELLEIKNLDSFQFKKEWKVGFEIEATPYIEIQVQHQLLVSGLPTAYIGALVGGNEGKILKREPNKKTQDAILLKAEKFWKEIDND